MLAVLQLSSLRQGMQHINVASASIDACSQLESRKTLTAGVTAHWCVVRCVIAMDTVESIPIAPFKMADQDDASVMCLVYSC